MTSDARRDTERGAVALLLAVALAIAAALVVQVARLGAHAVAQARAETAADAAALAAADALALGRGADVALRNAVRTAEANGAELVPADCDCTGRLVTVKVVYRFRPVGGVEVVARARSRAEIRPVFAQFAR